MLYRLMFETSELEPIDDWDVYEDRDVALFAFDTAVAHPPEGVGSVYLVEDDGYTTRVIAGHYFVDATGM